MDYGKKIAYLRKTKGMTQEELGKVLNVTYQAVSKWERGESLPDFETMSQMAKYFQVPLGYFADENEELAETAAADALSNASAEQ
ncbi:MAG: helix-turn-helix domain-containing protein, partial [Clostridia bacterium]|nr:helix-turn-helix domain-containing protein [Clostridia bacterium]